MESMTLFKYLFRGPWHTWSRVVFDKGLNGGTVVGRGKSSIAEDVVDLVASCFNSFCASFFDPVATEALLFEALLSVYVC